jgi:peptidoglycan hydrolase-like protein with peptidoglycan-binding domain
MKLSYLLIFILLLAFTQAVSAQNPCNLTSTMRIGSKGDEVKCLQTLIGVNADGKFGPLTKAKVVSFQLSKGLVPDGIVGPLSRLALNGVVASARTTPPAHIPVVDIKVQPPKIFSVSPEKVRSGDTVKIFGENFSPTGNNVRIIYGQIDARFNGLSSSDGKTLSFTYQPPDVRNMGTEELLNLPSTVLGKILDPLRAAGGSIEDIANPYRNIKNENELRQVLSRNGHDFDELYDKFYVTIENTNGWGTSEKPILAGLRKLSFGSNLANADGKSLLSKVNDSLSNFFTPKKAHAQTPQGGTNSGLITYCTCGEGYLTTMVDFSGNGGSGIYWWSSGFRPTVGDPIIAGPQLGFFIQNAGMCVMYFGTGCGGITANIASLPWGEAP